MAKNVGWCQKYKSLKLLPSFRYRQNNKILKHDAGKQAITSLKPSAMQWHDLLKPKHHKMVVNFFPLCLALIGWYQTNQRWQFLVKEMWDFLKCRTLSHWSSKLEKKPLKNHHCQWLVMVRNFQRPLPFHRIEKLTIVPVKMALICQGWWINLISWINSL